MVGLFVLRARELDLGCPVVLSLLLSRDVLGDNDRYRAITIAVSFTSPVPWSGR